MITVYVVGQGMMILPLKKSLILHIRYMDKNTDYRKIDFIFAK